MSGLGFNDIFDEALDIIKNGRKPMLTPKLNEFLDKEMQKGLEFYNVPAHTFESIRNYILYGLEPGSFVHAVLTNNLCEAVGRADVENTVHLKDIVGFVYNHIPSSAWKNEENVANWILSTRKRDTLEGKNEELDGFT